MTIGLVDRYVHEMHSYKAFHVKGKIPKDEYHYVDQITDSKNRLIRTEMYMYGNYSKSIYFYDEHNNILREDKYIDD